jgi:hypothetical protein
MVLGQMVPYLSASVSAWSHWSRSLHMCRAPTGWEPGTTVVIGPGENGAIPVGKRDCLVPLKQISAHVQGLHWLGGL